MALSRTPGAGLMGYREAIRPVGRRVWFAAEHDGGVLVDDAGDRGGAGHRRLVHRGGGPVARCPGVVAAIGCTLGVVPHMVAAITGLAALLNASAVAFQPLKYAGIAYLLYVLGKPMVVAWVRRTFAASYVLLAGRLAVQDR